MTICIQLLDYCFSVLYIGVMPECAYPSSDPSPTRQSSRRTVLRPKNRAEKLIAFRQALASGCTCVDASKAAGISPRTGERWKADMMGGAISMGEVSALVATKTELAQLYTRIARSDEVAPRDRIAAAGAHAELLGLNEPTKAQVLTVSVSADTVAWIDAEMAQLTNSQPDQLAQHTDLPQLTESTSDKKPYVNHIGESARTHMQDGTDRPGIPQAGSLEVGELASPDLQKIHKDPAKVTQVTESNVLNNTQGGSDGQGLPGKRD